jgi:hypothetical protein
MRIVGRPAISLLLLLVGSPLLAEVITSDINKDGNPDAWSYVTNGYVEKQEIDMNYDGKVDAIYLYDGAGKVVEEVLDTDYDGRMDNWREYEDGNLVLDQVDSNRDGKIDVWVYVDRGKIYKTEKDTTGDGKPDTVNEY